MSGSGDRHTQAGWRIVDAHECSECGYLHRGRDGIMAHLREHEQTNQRQAEASALIAATGHDVRVTPRGLDWVTDCLTCGYTRDAASKWAANVAGLNHLRGLTPPSKEQP